MKTIRAFTNLHCPKCGNDIITIIKSVPINTIAEDNRKLECHWPGCDWNGRYCDLAKEAGEQL